MNLENVGDLDRLKYGTCSFTENGTACIGTIDDITYIAIGHGLVNVSLINVREVVGGAYRAAHQSLTVACFMATIENRTRELIITETMPGTKFGATFSFRVKN